MFGQRKIASLTLTIENSIQETSNLKAVEAASKELFVLLNNLPSER